MEKVIFKKRYGILKRVLSCMLVFSMVLTMGAFSQLKGILAEAASESVQSPLIEENDDGTYDVTFTYQDEGEYGTISSVEVMGNAPGLSWTPGESVAMKETESNLWTAIMSGVVPGTYGYKFLIDGVNGAEWITDPLNDEENEGNSLLKLKGSYTHVSPEVKGNEVTFRYESATAEQVRLAGTMTNWDVNAIKLTKGDNNIWSLTQTLPVGSYEYKFILDDSNWQMDQVNDSTANGNNVVVVPGLADGTLSVVKGEEAELPKLSLFKEDGSDEKVTPSYSLKDTSLKDQVSIADGKLTVSNDCTEDTIVLTASYDNETAEVTVSVMEEEEEKITLKVYYRRADGNYDGWDLYMWDADNTGSITNGGYEFSSKEGDYVVATVDVAPGAGELGYIVRSGGESWAGKDVEEDQFIDLTGILSGTVSLYIESGEKNSDLDLGDDVVTGIMVKRANYNEDGNTITVELTGKAEDDNLNTMFEVSGKDGAVGISKVEAGDGHIYTVYLNAALDISKSYSITYDGKEYDVHMPNYYVTQEFEEKYTYTGDDLGATWTKEKTTFRLWAPDADSVVVNRYESGTPEEDDLIETIEMTEDINGTWVAEKEGDLNGTYYTYTIVREDDTTEDVCDPYARTTGINGKRAMVIDLDSTNPDGWDTDSNPHEGQNITDAIIYEGHIRDLTVDETSGVSEDNRGKFLGLTEDNAKAVEHMKELGITYFHVLPVYDFGSVNETGEGSQYNWGYDPVNYNVPEGSYSTDPYNGEVRVKELKQMVHSLHQSDISVVMDVVYNHVYNANEFCINKIVPNYFSRFNDNGAFYSDSGCGNDTASERSMVRKYIVDSVCYWADEYHIDGFRFDLVGLLDVDTINEIVTEVHKTHPDVIFYGEGWDMANEEVAGQYTMATKDNSTKTPEFAYFNDSIRDTLKGNVFDATKPGYVSGEQGDEETIAKNFLGAADWCSSPSQTINYASCHDNNTLFDRLAISREDASEEDLIRMNNLAAAIYLTAEGVPFMQAGEEFLRSKVNEDGTFNENSYNAGDEVNAIRWGNLEDATYADVFEYYKGLIAFRKAHAALRLTTSEDVDRAVTLVEGLDKNVVAFDIQGGINGETADEIYVIFNANTESTSVTLPAGEWSVYINDKKAGTDVIETITNGTATVAPISAMVLVRNAQTQTPVPTQIPGGTVTTPATDGSVTTPTTDGSVSADPKVGDTVKDTASNASYLVTKTGANGTVQYKKPLSNKATVKIPAKITINGKSYKVTSVAAKALNNNKKVTKLVIGKNVKTIGKKAFYGCKKLKNIQINTTLLKKANVGANAFKGTLAKVTVKVPKAKLKTYKKILSAKGLSKKATVKKK